MLRFSPNPNRAHLIPWMEWSDEAFRVAREQNKPVMLYLCAFWCGYCQRMDQEAFSETENIALLKAYFVSIRAENAQRPDIDSRYNQNGWPTIVFMTPLGDPIVATNYMPADQFEDLLLRVYMGHQQGQGNASAIAAYDENAAVPLQIIAQPGQAQLDEITAIVMHLADKVNGGYGDGQKFIQPEANDFLLARYEATRDPKYLDQVRLTLNRMRAGPIHDDKDGAYFRTTTGADWTRPHREKLLGEEAGLLSNCLRVFKTTQEPVYAEMADDIIRYLNRKLYDPDKGSFYGCEDFIRTFPDGSGEEFSTIIDRCIYTDANAQTIRAYLDASLLLGKEEYKEAALSALEFLWTDCRGPDGGLFHYHDDAPRVCGLLNDQVQLGLALLIAHAVTGEAKYLDRAKDLAEFVLMRLKNPSGGYYDICTPGQAFLKLRLTLIEQNGPAASFFLELARATGEKRYRDAALWAYQPFQADFKEYGIHAASFGIALGKWSQSQ
ncbi:MAG: thioredoxin domain-containing protein [Deltaproteobacteria bacterium]|nr:thioredoxin domain-containing protein [Deltaproteobacteria bacterium]